MNRRRSFVGMTWLLLAVLVLGILPHATAQAAPSVALVDRDRLLVQQPAADEPVQSSPDGKGYRFERAGWVYLHIEGDPYERGYQHGFLMALELADVQKMLRHITPWKTGVGWEEVFIPGAEEQWSKWLTPEYADELKGIADGATAAGTEITWQEVLAWNGQHELFDYWWPGIQGDWYKQQKADYEHCSAFIANGDWTTDGRIVIAHNTWQAFPVGQYDNVLLDIVPSDGNRIFMQATPGNIHSGSDYFVTGAGIMGTETTISGFSGYIADEAPEFLRLRQAVQYAESLDDFVAIMEQDNNGGYANSWLLGDQKSGEIMRFELGLKYSSVDRTDNGYFLGFNSASDLRIRNLETKDKSYLDVRTPAGARRVRLTQLMNEHKGALDVPTAQAMLADHYDVYLEKEQPGWRTIDGHTELDPMLYVSGLSGRPAFDAHGAVDGKVMDSAMAADLSISARWGNSSGLPFVAADYLAAHPQFDYLDGYLKDRPTQPWVTFTAGENAPAAAAPAVPDAPAPAAGERVPLADALGTLEPAAFWQHFYDLTQVPRPSHHEEQATTFVKAYGESLGLETIADEAGNVIIRKPASPGLEDRPGVILQAHLDMVPQKTPDSTHDFLTDPIDAYVEDGWVHADRTTLGADDGSGVATIMALLEDDALVHPPLEALFTTNEEDGFGGISALATDVLKGRYYINIDNEVEGQYLISSAGGVNATVSATYDEEPAPAGMTGVQVTVDGLRGGHSGVDIDKGRGSAHQLMARLLWNAPAELGVRVASLAGGNQANAIPRTTTVIAAVPEAQADAFTAYVAEFAATVQHELAATEANLTVTAAPADLPAQVMAAPAQRALIGAVYGAPQGVIRMSDEVPGLVETSGNIGVLNMVDGKLDATILVRSAVDSARDDAAARFASVFELGGATVTIHDAYGAWPPNPDSALLATMQQVYVDLYGAEPKVAAIHAGLETSVAGVKYPGLDMISVGPTILDVHSPDERMEVATVQKVYDLLVATLAQLQ
ncbi:MAG: beta-Ala-His dipeptidase [Caldilinea sp.]|nr:beta-Ala-His dipeptidase [Caldilineaceae bacterium]MCB9122063.1 beta-Ala-His dipeptidase [Caldilineaceae bacterium]MCW5839999.1 beta-Ala-His dipeptidase [Caldilinea sp.]